MASCAADSLPDGTGLAAKEPVSSVWIAWPFYHDLRVAIVLSATLSHLEKPLAPLHFSTCVHSHRDA